MADKTNMKDGLVKRGSTWSYIVRVRDPQTGRMKSRWVGGFATRTEARTARNDARSAADKGTAVAANRMTVSEYLSDWLTASATQVKPTTLVSYKLHVEKYITPRIGAEKLQHLSPMMVAQLYTVLQKEGGQDRRKLKKGEKPAVKGLSATTVKHVRSTLHKALSDAVRQRLIPYNPADAVRAPKVERDSDGAGEMKVWTREELETFLDSSATDRLFPMWRLAAWTGMRRGEVCGLTWRDVDLDAGTVTVQRARVTVTSGDIRESKPKTATGRRQVELDNETLAALRTWRKRQKLESEEWPGEWPAHGLVFTLEDGSALHPDFLTRTFQTLGKKAKVPQIRLHDLRHTHATLLIAAGVPVKVVSERLGHSTPSFTMTVYQHVLPGMQREAVQLVADAKQNPSRRLKVVGA